MATPSGSDRSLLDRLNALKPTSVNLDPSQNALNIPTDTVAQEAQPVSREDALSARLRTLRNRPGGGASPQAGGLSRSDSGGDVTVPSRGESSLVTQAHAPSVPGPGGEEDDPLYIDDEDALHEFLENLPPDEEEQWTLDHADEEVKNAAAILSSLGKEVRDRKPVEAEDDEAARVAALLASLGREVQNEDRPSHDDHEHDDDDSDGEQMGQEIDHVLARARDEAELAEEESPSGSEESTRGEESGPARNGKERGKADSTSPGPTASDDNPFTLPTVPTRLPPPPDADRASFDFENDIAARMAALKGLGQGQVTKTDAFGLPSAPTFQPEDHRPGPSTSRKKKGGFTDEDMKTWCVVCLEDATVRCVGCDDDVYCELCWQGMHVGPSAGFDERGHRRVKFVKGGG